MADYSRAQSGRASAVLTTGEVAGAAVDLHRVKDKLITVDVSFTIGMLTNVILYFYGSMDGTTYDIIRDGIIPVTETLTASTETLYVVQCPPGVKFFRVSAKGTGTVTSSLLDYTYRYDRIGSP